MSRPTNWSNEEIDFLISQSNEISSKEISKVLGRTEKAISKKRFLLGVKINKGYGVKTVWTNDMLRFITDNYEVFSNRELADKMGVTLTVLRNKLSELNLKRVEYEKWTAEQVQFLIENYQTLGDVAIAEYFNENMPKSYSWTKKMIQKKRLYLNLKRKENETHTIRHNNSTTGKAATIGKNSASANLPDVYVATMMSGGSRKLDINLRTQILQHKQLVELKRTQFKLKRQCQKLANTNPTI